LAAKYKKACYYIVEIAKNGKTGIHPLLEAGITDQIKKSVKKIG